MVKGKETKLQGTLKGKGKDKERKRKGKGKERTIQGKEMMKERLTV